MFSEKPYFFTIKPSIEGFAEQAPKEGNMMNVGILDQSFFTDGRRNNNRKDWLIGRRLQKGRKFGLK